MIIRIISYLLYVLIACAIVVLVLDRLDRPAMVESSVSSCAEPLTYYIHSIDEQFNLTHAELRRFVGGAGSLWSDAAGHRLLAYDAEGDVAVHLIYDERQQLVEKERELTGLIQSERMKFDRHHREYTRNIQQYEEAMESYESLLEQYQQKLTSHNEKVALWNERGGAPEREKLLIRGREQALERLKQELLSQQNRVNTLAERVETMAEQLDGISGSKQQMLDEYNDRFAGEYRFNQGEFVNTKEGRRINIYHYTSLNHLKHVLAHEVGHALGLGHVESPESVMHPVVQSSGRANVSLSEEDIRAIQTMCR